MDDLRKRVPFRFNIEDAGSENAHVLDDQEQEALISDLRDRAAQTNRGFQRVLQTLTGLSCFLHIIFFFGLTSLLNEPAIALARLFALIQVLVHTELLLLLTPTLDTVLHRFARDQPHLPVSMSWSLGVSSLAPLVSISSGKSWQQSGWWCTTLAIALVVRTTLRWIKEGEESIKELEGLQYDAKGA